MKYQTYQKYKTSGIEWIGEIPVDWEVIKLKHIARIETGNTPSKTDDRYYEDGFFPWIRPDELGNLKPIVESKIKLNKDGKQLARKIPKDSILVCCIGSVGKMGVAGVELATNQQINSVIPIQKKLNNAYAKYILLASEEIIKSIGNSNVVAIVNKSQQGEILYSLPGINEQKQIADFLDKKTKQIDDLIKKDKQLIELLKEKRIALINKAVTRGLDNKAKLVDSGVDWIGKIPEGWEVVTLKRVLKNDEGIKIGPFGSMLKLEEVIDAGFKVYGQEHAIKRNFTLGNKYISSDKFKEMKQYQLFSGDLIVTMMGTTGKAQIVPNNIEPGIMDSHLIRLRFNCKVDPRFMEILVNNSAYVIGELKYFNKGSIMEGLNSTIIKSLILAIPNRKIQETIINYLDKESQTVDIFIKKTRKRIKLLEEYKKSLIYNAVTGKIKV